MDLLLSQDPSRYAMRHDSCFSLLAQLLTALLLHHSRILLQIATVVVHDYSGWCKAVHAPVFSPIGNHETSLHCLSIHVCASLLHVVRPLALQISVQLDPLPFWQSHGIVPLFDGIHPDCPSLSRVLLLGHPVVRDVRDLVIVVLHRRVQIDAHLGNRGSLTVFKALSAGV